MAQTYRSINIGTHRGKPRLWLEGTWLGIVGFQRGAFFTTRITPGRITLKVLENGKAVRGTTRTVSGKTKNGRDVSVIDINSHDIPFTGAARVVPSFDGGTLVITPEAQ
jgi:DNA (cytosine-5)-methyltransferase 1